MTPPAAPSELLLVPLQAGGGGLLGQLLLMGAIFGFFWFLLVRPQRRAEQEHRKLLDSLKKGDRVVTDGGILGTVHQVLEDRVVLEVGDRVRIPFLKTSVRQRLAPPKADDPKRGD